MTYSLRVYRKKREEVNPKEFVDRVVLEIVATGKTFTECKELRRTLYRKSVIFPERSK